MKLLLDENLSTQIAAELVRRGHDVISVLEAGLVGQEDDAIARVEQNLASTS